jgi:hypothetical protein
MSQEGAGDNQCCGREAKLTVLEVPIHAMSCCINATLAWAAQSREWHDVPGRQRRAGR